MTHESFTRTHQFEGSSNRSFGLVFTVVFLLIGLMPLLYGEDALWWAVAVSCAFGFASFVTPHILAPLNKVWTRIGMVLHAIMNPLILGVMFFLVIVPTGTLMRLLRKDPLHLRKDRQASTYWLDRTPPGPSPESLRDQF